MKLKAGQLIFVLPGQDHFGPLLDINLAKFVGGCKLVNGFSHPLASLGKINAAIEQQQKDIAGGQAEDTGISPDKKFFAAKRRLRQRQRPSLDVNLYQAGVLFPLVKQQQHLITVRVSNSDFPQLVPPPPLNGNALPPPFTSPAVTSLPFPPLMKSKIYWRLAAVPFLAFGLQSVRAQTPGAINQVDSTQQRRSLEQSAQLNFEQGDAAPELYPGESDDLGPQSVLKIKPRRQWISGTLDSQLFHTDNMFLERDDAHSTMVLASTAQVALAPTAYQMGSGLVSPRVGYRALWFDYSGTQRKSQPEFV